MGDAVKYDPGFYTTPPENEKLCQTLLPEEIELLKKIRDMDSDFVDDVLAKDKLEGLCMHRGVDSDSTIIPVESTDLVRCILCGKEFHIKDKLTREEVEQKIGEAIDIIQTLKILFVDMSPETARGLFIVLPLLEKVPELYSLGQKSFEAYKKRWDRTVKLEDDED